MDKKEMTEERLDKSIKIAFFAGIGTYLFLYVFLDLLEVICEAIFL